MQLLSWLAWLSIGLTLLYGGLVAVRVRAATPCGTPDAFFPVLPWTTHRPPLHGDDRVNCADLVGLLVLSYVGALACWIMVWLRAGREAGGGDAAAAGTSARAA